MQNAANERKAPPPEQARPRFRPDIVAHNFEEESQGRSIVLEDPVANKFFRLSSYEYELLRLLDGKITVEEAIQRVRLRGRYFTKDNALRLVGQCARSGLLLGTAYGTSGVIAGMKKTIKKAAAYKSLSRLYFIFIPILNPDRFLDKTLWLWNLIVNRYTAALMTALVPGAAYLFIAGLPRYSTEFLFFFNLSNLLVLWIAIALVKLAHEFSHAYTAKNLGLRVPEMGVAFLLFFPCLYCNTTAAWQVAERNERLSIAAAGILAEAVVAMISVYVWYFTKPGLVNSVAFWLMAISLVSSLFFNGNPLMRYDGYFLLTDMLRMPNLQGRAYARVRYLFLNRVWGIESVTDRKTPGKEAAILVTYGISAMVYRVFLYAGIVAAVYYKFDKTIGLMFGIVAFCLFIVAPVVKGTLGLVGKRSEMKPRLRGMITFLILMVAVLWLLTRPWSDKSVYPCYLESSLVRQIVIPVQAPVDEVYVREGDDVTADKLVLRLDPTPLQFLLSDKESERELIDREIKIIEDTGRDMVQLPIKRIELMKAKAAIDKVKDDLNNLEWRTPFHGTIARLTSSVQKGGRFGKGAVVGELASKESCRMVALVPEADVAQITPGQVVQIWLPIAGGRLFSLRIKEVSPFNREDLEGSPLSSRLGGEIATEQRNEYRRESPLDAYYACRMDFPNPERIPLGITGRMVIRHAPKSALERFIHNIYQTFNREMVF